MHLYKLLLLTVVVTLAIPQATIKADPPKKSDSNDAVKSADLVPALKTDDFIRPVDPVKNVLPTDSAAIMNEIISIRKMFGDLLEGTDLSKSVLDEAPKEPKPEANDAVFKSVLQQVIQTTPPAPVSGPITTPPTPPFRSEQQVVGMLRGMCSQLETQANQLEESRDYSRADQLRALAQQIRLQAREFEKPRRGVPAPQNGTPYLPLTSPPAQPATWNRIVPTDKTPRVPTYAPSNQNSPTPIGLPIQPKRPR